MTILKDLKLEDIIDQNASRGYYWPKCIIKNYNVIINGKTFYDQHIDTNIKWYEEIRKLTAGQGKDYTTKCLLDYNYIKNH